MLIGTQPTKVKVVGTFHVPFTRNHSKCTQADGTTERACYFYINVPSDTFTCWLNAIRFILLESRSLDLRLGMAGWTDNDVNEDWDSSLD